MDDALRVTNLEEGRGVALMRREVSLLGLVLIIIHYSCALCINVKSAEGHKGVMSYKY